MIIGIDDAGRGPLIGPMVLAGVLIRDEDSDYLKKEGVDDSKKLQHKTRIKLSKTIEMTALKFKAVISIPDEIDHAVHSGMNLNTLEAVKTAEIINNLTEGLNEKVKVVVDCPSVNIKAWRRTVLGYVGNDRNVELVCEHKADANHVSVSAASIIAKCVREEEVEKLKAKYNLIGNIGSGYPSDPMTKKFLREHGKDLKDSGIFRKSWATWKELFEESEQTTLNF